MDRVLGIADGRARLEPGLNSNGVRLRSILSFRQTPITMRSTRNICVNIACRAVLPSAKGLSIHYARRPACRARMRAMWESLARQLPIAPSSTPLSETEDEPMTDANIPTANADIPMVDAEAIAGNSGQRRRGVSVEEVEDEGDTTNDSVNHGIWSEQYHGAAITKGEGLSPYWEEQRRREHEGCAPWAPFNSLNEWGFVEWMMKSGVSQERIDELVQLPFVSVILNVMIG